jgi:peptidylprolyl isomerase
MKLSALISSVILSCLFASCAGGSEGSTKRMSAAGSNAAALRQAARRRTVRRERLAITKAEHAKSPSITITRRSGPPPQHLIVHDLRKGKGAAVTPKDAIVVSYFSNTYENALKESRTGRYGPSRFGMNEVIKGWALGLPGMKAGGRRELIVPPKLGYEGFTGIYVIDLLAVERNGAASF